MWLYHRAFPLSLPVILASTFYCQVFCFFSSSSRYVVASLSSLGKSRLSLDAPCPGASPSPLGPPPAPSSSEHVAHRQETCLCASLSPESTTCSVSHAQPHSAHTQAGTHKQCHQTACSPGQVCVIYCCIFCPGTTSSLSRYLLNEWMNGWMHE